MVGRVHKAQATVFAGVGTLLVLRVCMCVKRFERGRRTR